MKPDLDRPLNHVETVCMFNTALSEFFFLINYNIILIQGIRYTFESKKVKDHHR